MSFTSGGKKLPSNEVVRGKGESTRESLWRGTKSMEAAKRVSKQDIHKSNSLDSQKLAGK